ncbi:hypothetical protein LYSIN_03104 [Lysinibacillus sphaericus]|uniref:Uncharacterized protein n=1 Tax=Lysinibacillus sphaericus TaxID=1421 RepID=A0A2S5D5G0_LYSSH|nr:hypothetical protein LYSIN_03104 [Lysinibacillus sphaericus]
MIEKKQQTHKKKATQAYRERNREKTRKQSAKSAARTYINKYCELEDLHQ